MNRKLLVIAIVPLLIGLSGAAAFSEFSGSIYKSVTVTTGTATVTEQVYCVESYVAPGTLITAHWSISGGGTIPKGSQPSGWLPILDGKKGKACSGYLGWSWDPKGTDAGNTPLGPPITFLGTGVTSQAVFQVSFQYLAPGDWILLKLVDSIAPSSTLPATLQYYAPFSPAGSATMYNLDPNPCTPFYAPGAPLGTVTGSGQKYYPGLEYCIAGPLASGSGSYSPASGTPASFTICPDHLWACVPTPDPHGVPGDQNVNYILIGLDNSATAPADMGISGTLGFVIGVTAP